MRRALGAIAVVLCFGSELFAQDAAPRPGTGPIAQSADRLARQMWPIDPDALVDDDGRPRFRATVIIEDEELSPPWLEPYGIHDNSVHRQFLRQVTPEGFRSSTLYPIGMSVDPATIVNGVKSAWRSWQEQRIRERIRKEVEQLEARRAAAETQ
jgi:hypothetical protein